MKIALIHQPTGPIWLPGTSGSVSIWVYEVARRLARSNRVIVYARRGFSQSKSEIYEGVEYRRVSVKADEKLLKFLKPFSYFRDIKRPLFASRIGYLNYIRTIARDLKNQSCDIIHIVGFPQFAPILRVLNPGIPIILHMHGEWLTQFDPQMVEGWLNNVDLIICVSDYVGQKIRNRFSTFSTRCKTIYMGVDPGQFKGSNGASLKKTNGSKRLLFVGRVSPEKGLHVLVEAFQKVVKQCPEATLKIVGPEWLMPREYIVELSDAPEIRALSSFYNDGYLSRLRKQVPSYLANHVSFVDLVEHEDINAYFHDADLYVNPSFSESLGMSIIEAMASQLPVVATRVGGVPEVVEEDKTGILVEPGDVDSLARAILRVLEDQDLRASMAKAARKRAVEVFSWERICENLLNLYQTVL